MHAAAPDTQTSRTTMGHSHPMSNALGASRRLLCTVDSAGSSSCARCTPSSHFALTVACRLFDGVVAAENGSLVDEKRNESRSSSQTHAAFRSSLRIHRPSSMRRAEICSTPRRGRLESCNVPFNARRRPSCASTTIVQNLSASLTDGRVEAETITTGTVTCDQNAIASFNGIELFNGEPL